jgi:hypothetical protein
LERQEANLFGKIYDYVFHLLKKYAKLLKLKPKTPAGGGSESVGKF